MSLLRFTARSMLASYFVINGVRALRQPEESAALAKPVADRVLPMVNSAFGDRLAGYLPEDPEGFVKCNGVLQIVGGLSLATGIGRRLGAGMLAVSLVPHVLWSNPVGKQGAERTTARAQLRKNVALLGGVLLASQDTEGRPDLAWKIRTQRELAAKQAAAAERAKQAAEKSAQKRDRRGRKRSSRAS